jgi:hypothetical protein
MIGDEKRKKHTINYRDNETDQQLYDWIENERGILRAQDFIKKVLYEKMLSNKK